MTALMETLIDDFNDESIDASKWEVNHAAQIIESGGGLRLSTILAGNSAEFSTIDGRTFTGSHVTIKVVDAGDQSLGSYSFYPIYLYSDDQTCFEISTNIIRARKSGGSVVWADSYNPSIHVYLRIRENGGMTYWDYSGDGIIWTTAASVANSISMTGMYVYILVSSGSEASTTTAIVDNFNVLPSPEIPPSRYAIELRDSDFSLKARLEPYATSVKWEWNRIGGCGRCTITVAGDYNRFRVNADDDIRIYLPNADLTADLWYRGYVESVAPVINGGQESIQIECMGYFGWLSRVIVHDVGEEMEYENMEISEIVAAILTDFVVPASSVTLGTVQASRYSVDRLNFKSKASDAIGTLIDLIGTVECGIDETLAFFWYNQGTEITDRFFLGDKVAKQNDRFDFKNIINKIYFEGGKVGDVAYKRIGISMSSQNRYGKRESIVSNGSIVTDATAQQYITGILRQDGKPKRQMAVSLMNLNRRIERNRPMGLFTIRDSEIAQDPPIWGTTANGGSNITYGSRLHGGSGRYWGGESRYSADRISYTLSTETGRVHADIQFGDSLSVSRASAAMKRIEENLNAVRQRSL